MQLLNSKRVDAEELLENNKIEEKQSLKNLIQFKLIENYRNNYRLS